MNKVAHKQNKETGKLEEESKSWWKRKQERMARDGSAWLLTFDIVAPSCKTVQCDSKGLFQRRNRNRTEQDWELYKIWYQLLL